MLELTAFGVGPGRVGAAAARPLGAGSAVSDGAAVGVSSADADDVGGASRGAAEDDASAVSLGAGVGAFDVSERLSVASRVGADFGPVSA